MVVGFAEALNGMAKTDARPIPQAIFIKVFMIFTFQS